MEQHKTLDKLVYMANQIGKFFVSENKATSVPAITDHIGKFWDPHMRAEIVAHAREGGAGLDPPVKEAVLALKAPAVPAAAPRP